MKNILVSLFVFALLFTATQFVSAQETFTHPTAHVSVTVPGGWHYEANGTTMTMYPSSKDLAVVFNVIDASAIDAAVEKAVNDINSSFPGATVNSPSQVMVNGMTASEITGTTTDGRQFSYALLVTPSAKVLEVAFVANSEQVSKYTTELALIVGSIKPAN
jgi:predicted Zn-dependent protease